MSTDNSTAILAPASLLESDIAAFAEYRIPPALLAEAGIRRVTDAEARADFGIKGSPSQDMSGIVFPYYIPAVSHRVTARVRRDRPEVAADGKIQNKYILAWGDGRHLFFPPGAAEKLEGPETIIVLVESEKAALALTAWAQRNGVKLVALALGGCWGWRGKIGIEEGIKGEREEIKGPLADLSYCRGRKAYVLLDSNVETNFKVQAAQRALITALREKGASEVLVCDLPLLEGVNGPDDYLAATDDEAMLAVFESARPPEQRPARVDGTPTNPGFADDALALKFSALHGEDLRYTALWGRWSRWDGTRWSPDETLRVFDLARAVCRDAAETETPQIAARITSAQTVYAVERLARSDRRHAAIVTQWDASPWLLNTPGGVVDLQTGELRPARREDHITKITAAAPEGDCPLWLSFLERITDGDKELQGYMQRMVGYALTGVTREHALFFLYGTGANGKSVFLNTIAGVLGDYAKTAPIEAFIASKSEHHPTDLAGLQGARLVTAVETEDGRRWAESKIKSLTGGDRIAARFMRQDFFEYTPQFKLVIAGNHKPGLRTVDEAMRRRFNLLPFTVTIPAAERDLELAEKLRAEWGGILRWAVEGCHVWRRDGLHAPQAVEDATADYLAAEDVLARWIDERCKLSKANWAAASALFADWRQWCDENQEYAGSQKRFSESLESRGFVPNRTMIARGFLGIGLMTDMTDRPIIPVTRAPARLRPKPDDVSYPSCGAEDEPLQ